MQVVKRDGTLEKYDGNKIKAAIEKAAKAVEVDLGDKTLQIAAVITNCLPEVPTVEEIQDEVERLLMEVSPKTAKAYILYRDQRSKLRELHPDPEALPNYIHAAKYARNIGDRLETFEESVNRVEVMHLNKFPESVHKDIEWAFDFVRRREVLPSMRSMQFGGKAIEVENCRMYNCSFTYIDRLRSFSEIFYLLLCGCGAGYSIQFQHVGLLSKLNKPSKVQHYTIEDTSKGWAYALDALIHSYIMGDYVEFNYSKIRPLGSELKTSGGKAPGHLPLKKLLEKVRTILDGAVGRHLKPIECHDIICHSAEAVLSGGIRRSSLIALFSKTDEEMLLAKSSNELKTNPQRHMANNSVVLDECTKEDFMRLMGDNYYGEPGFFFGASDHGTNPCGEIGLYPKYDGKSGVAFCNLTEVNVSKCSSFVDAVRAAAIIGTLQAAYTEFGYLLATSQHIAEEQALLGVSLTGIMDKPECLNPDFLQNCAQVAIDTNQEIAKKIGIRPAKRITCVKPSGTASLLLNCSPGIHPRHAKRYFRRVTANPLEDVAIKFREVNPHMVEVKPNGDLCITFPIEAPEGAITRSDTFEFLEAVFLVYDNWIRPASFEKPTHNVSCTVSYFREQWPHVLEKVWENRHRISAMSFLEYASDDLPFMPCETVKDEGKWRSLIEKYRPVNEFIGNANFDCECGVEA